MNKDYGLHSGERQTANELNGIRKDHIFRYDTIKNFIQKNVKLERLSIADIFCGNGYGSYILGGIKNSFVFGIDGSIEAINQASKYYSKENVFFSQKIFPFELPHGKFDVVCSIESIEHVEDDKNFIKQLDRTLSDDGYLIVSTPNSNIISLEKNPNKFHFRHYKLNEIKDMFCELEFITFFGQNTYSINENGFVTGTLEDEEMKLVEGVEGQFNICIFRKKESFFNI
jgi:2-polyprenyl-3-methyl-5-hydroxy-6-metoxy-1,4-benzoquinol methylase